MHFFDFFLEFFSVSDQLLEFSHAHEGVVLLLSLLPQRFKRISLLFLKVFKQLEVSCMSICSKSSELFVFVKGHFVLVVQFTFRPHLAIKIPQVSFKVVFGLESIFVVLFSIEELALRLLFKILSLMFIFARQVLKGE